MKSVDIVQVRLSWLEENAGPPAPHLLRGALGNLHRDEALFHQHEESRVIYRYPLVQYRWDWRGAAVLGIGEGARALARADWPRMELKVGERVLHVREAACQFRRHTIAVTDTLIRYRFAAPWLPLNQELYERYLRLAPAVQARERDRLAVAGLLLALRGFGVEVRARLYAAFEMGSSLRTRYKDVLLLGFRGRLLANVDVPDGFALGRAVSHGYGWLEREERAETEEPDDR
jgi:Cas6b C-terminal domain/Cas6b N-terminal domain